MGLWGVGMRVEVGGGGGPRLTFLLHASPEALLKPAVTALVPLVFVHHTLPTEPGEKLGGLDAAGTALQSLAELERRPTWP